mgnify:CR=1 FL=1
MIDIRNSAEGAEIHINGDIMDDMDGELIKAWGIESGFDWPDNIRKQLDQIDTNMPLTVYINSDGGSVQAGVAIANMIANHKGPTTSVVEGWACSIATEIFFAARERKIPANSYLMIHKPSCTVTGNADELLQAVETLDAMQKGIESVYRNAARQGVTDEEIHNMVNRTTWLSGEEAAKFFKVDVLKPTQAVAKFGNARSLLDKIPAGLSLVDAKEDMAKKLEAMKKRQEQTKIIKAALMAAEGI